MFVSGLFRISVPLAGMVVGRTVYLEVGFSSNCT